MLVSGRSIAPWGKSTTLCVKPKSYSRLKSTLRMNEQRRRLSETLEAFPEGGTEIPLLSTSAVAWK